MPMPAMMCHYNIVDAPMFSVNRTSSVLRHRPTTAVRRALLDLPTVVDLFSGTVSLTFHRQASSEMQQREMGGGATPNPNLTGRSLSTRKCGENIYVHSSIALLSGHTYSETEGGCRQGQAQ